ncbi:MAG: hypothetical protein ABI808_04775 [Pseudonocardiales bacterium]
MTLAETRDAWHRVAEHVLAAGQYADTGEISLRPVPGGFQTTHELADGRRLGVVGTELVVLTQSGATRSASMTTVRAAAEFAQVVPGLPSSVYPPATPLELDAPLRIDAVAARVLADWYALGDRALRRFAGDVGADTGAEPILWPEHFDVGISVDDVDYGASPGDNQIDEPYVYVSASAARRSNDPFWNAPFGGYRPNRDIGTVAAALAYFHAGHGLLLT